MKPEGKGRGKGKETDKLRMRNSVSCNVRESARGRGIRRGRFLRAPFPPDQ